MTKQLRFMIILCTCAAFTACTSLRTVVDTQAGLASPAQPPLTPGDELTITTRDGARTQIALTSVASDFVEGSPEKGAPPRRFDLGQVIKIERREFDGMKTTFLVIVIAAGMYAIASAAAQASALSAL